MHLVPRCALGFLPSPCFYFAVIVLSSLQARQHNKLLLMDHVDSPTEWNCKTNPPKMVISRTKRHCMCHCRNMHRDLCQCKCGTLVPKQIVEHQTLSSCVPIRFFPRKRPHIFQHNRPGVLSSLTLTSIYWSMKERVVESYSTGLHRVADTFRKSSKTDESLRIVPVNCGILDILVVANRE